MQKVYSVASSRPLLANIWTKDRMAIQRPRLAQSVEQYTRVVWSLRTIPTEKPNFSSYIVFSCTHSQFSIVLTPSSCINPPPFFNLHKLSGRVSLRHGDPGREQQTERTASCSTNQKHGLPLRASRALSAISPSPRRKAEETQPLPNQSLLLRHRKAEENLAKPY